MSPVARNITLFCVFALIAWFCWSVRSVLNPLILGYLLAFVLHPLVLKLERRGWKRRKAVNVIFTAFAIFITLFLFGVYLQGRALAREFAAEDGLGHKVQQRVEQALEQHQQELQWVLQFLPHATEETASANGASATEAEKAAARDTELHFDDVARLLREWSASFWTSERAAQAGEIGAKAAGGLIVFFRDLLTVFGYIILLPIYTYFLLFELERIHGFVTRYLPRTDRERLVRIGRQIGEVLANFFRGRLLVCVAKGSFLTLGLWIAGIDYALLLGMGTGFLSLIPFVGSAIGFTISLLVGMIEHSLGAALLRTGIVFLAAEAFENYILIPKILGDSLGLHPVIVIFAIMAGGASLGMFGLLIALPLTATLVILGREFLLPVLAQWAETGGRSPPPAASP